MPIRNAVSHWSIILAPALIYYREITHTWCPGSFSFDSLLFFFIFHSHTNATKFAGSLRGGSVGGGGKRGSRLRSRRQYLYHRLWLIGISLPDHHARTFRIWGCHPPSGYFNWPRKLQPSDLILRTRYYSVTYPTKILRHPSYLNSDLYVSFRSSTGNPNDVIVNCAGAGPGLSAQATGPITLQGFTFEVQPFSVLCDHNLTRRFPLLQELCTRQQLWFLQYSSLRWSASPYLG